MTEHRIEAPVDDAVEQEQSISDEEEAEDWPEEIPFDANEADAAEQVRSVDLDEDDYR